MDARLWMTELTALVAAVASFAVLVVLLVVFDGRTIFQWQGITLNTIVSTLSVVMKALLMHSVAECVGQWKWILFHRSKRSLWDFERIDLASRGPLGSLYLIFQRKTPWDLRLGVIVILLAVAMDPFSQQLVQLGQTLSFTNDTNGTQATVPHADTYRLGLVWLDHYADSTVNPGETVVMTKGIPDLSMEAAILNGASQSMGTIRRHANVHCSTGNCTWPTIETLGVCHRCNDLTAQLVQVDGFGDFFNWETDFAAEPPFSNDSASAQTLPNGHFIININNCSAEEMESPHGCKAAQASHGLIPPTFQMTSYGTSNPNITISMQDIDTMIWSMSVIHLDESERQKRMNQWLESGSTIPPSPDETPWNYWPDIPLRATECALYYCVKSIQTRVDDNVLHEDVAEVTDVVRKPDSWQPKQDFNSNGVDYGFSDEEIPTDMRSLEFNATTASYHMEDLVLYYPNSSGKPEYSLAQNAVKSISALFQRTFKFATTQYQLEQLNYGTLREIIKEQIPAFMDLFNGLVRGIVANPPAVGGIWRSSNSDVALQFEILATSMTNDIRINGGKNGPDDIFWANETGSLLHSSTTPQFGSFGTVETLYRCEWYWISLHGVVFLGGAFFCIRTMLVSGRQNRESSAAPVWKTNSLAIVSHGLEAGTGTVLRRATTLRDLEKAAQSEMVLLSVPHQRSVSVIEKSESATIAVDVIEQPELCHSESGQSSESQEQST